MAATRLGGLRRELSPSSSTNDVTHDPRVHDHNWADTLCLVSLIPEKNRKTILDNIRSLDSKNNVMSHEHKVIAPNGEIRWQRWTNRKVFDKMGCCTGYLASFWVTRNLQ